MMGFTFLKDSVAVSVCLTFRQFKVKSLWLRNECMSSTKLTVTFLVDFHSQDIH